MIAMKSDFKEMCEKPWCLSKASIGEYCRFHNFMKQEGAAMNVAVAIMFFLGFVLVFMSLNGCASPRKDIFRMKELLAECRKSNRENARLVHEYQGQCARGPEQQFDSVNFGDGGH